MAQLDTLFCQPPKSSKTQGTRDLPGASNGARSAKTKAGREKISCRAFCCLNEDIVVFFLRQHDPLSVSLNGPKILPILLLNDWGGERNKNKKTRDKDGMPCLVRPLFSFAFEHRKTEDIEGKNEEREIIYNNNFGACPAPSRLPLLIGNKRGANTKRWKRMVELNKARERRRRRSL